MKAWAMNVAKKRGLAKARIALAGRIAVTLQKMWLTGEPFHWQKPGAAMA
jgi:hypothetical protein